MDATACNYDAEALSDDGSCGTDVDDDGLCDSEDNCTTPQPATMMTLRGGVPRRRRVRRVRRSGIAEGDCDCDGNQPDAIDVCGGTALDADDDGVCDTEDNCTDLEACTTTTIPMPFASTPISAVCAEATERTPTGMVCAMTKTCARTRVPATS